MSLITWFKVDDKLHDHRKARAAGASAMGVWLLAGSWSADNLTDGFLPSAILQRFGRQRDAKRLVEVGLWFADEQDGEPGWRFHSWDEFQPTREDTEKRRNAESTAGSEGNHRRWHVVKGITNRDCQFCRVPDRVPDRVNASGPESGANPPVPSRPDPTRTEETTTSSDKSDNGESLSRFGEFWDAYDHKVGRKKAESAYRSALKKPGVTDELLIAAAGEYVAWVKSEGKHPQYTKHPATWLNGEHWTDERAARHPPPTRIQQHLALAQKLADEQQPPEPPRQIGTGS